MPANQRFYEYEEIWRENRLHMREKMMKKLEDEENNIRINHVKKNIQLSGKINKIRDI